MAEGPRDLAESIFTSRVYQSPGFDDENWKINRYSGHVWGRWFMFIMGIWLKGIQNKDQNTTNNHGQQEG